MGGERSESKRSEGQRSDDERSDGESIEERWKRTMIPSVGMFGSTTDTHDRFCGRNTSGPEGKKEKRERRTTELKDWNTRWRSAFAENHTNVAGKSTYPS